MPEGSSQGASGQRAETLSVRASRATSSFLSSRLTYTVPRELGLAAQGDGGRHRAARRVDCGRVLAAPVEGEDAAGGRLVDDGVGILARLGLAELLESLQIEYRDRARAPVARKSAAQLRGEGDAVDALGVRDLACRGVGVGV
jgi:hypothetical protein